MSPDNDGRGQMLVVVGAGFYQEAVVATAQRMGYYVVTIDRDPAAPGALRADHRIVCSAHDAHRSWDELKQILPERPPVVGVLSGGARGCIHTTAVLARGLGLPGLDEESAGVLASKDLLRGRLSRAGHNTLSYRLVEHVDAVEALLAGTPLVLKPVRTSGGQGVGVIRTEQDIDRAWSNARAVSPDGPLLVEEYAFGRDMGVTGVAREGRIIVTGVLDKELNPGGVFGRAGTYIMPSSLSSEQTGLVKSFAQRVFKELGVSVGPCYLEMRMPERGPLQVIEVEASVTGSFVAQYLVPESTGQDYIAACINSVVGGAVADNWPVVRSAGCKFVYHDEKTRMPDTIREEPLPFAPWDGPRKALLTSGTAHQVRSVLQGLE